jgi:hypothetical protein
MRHEVGKHHLDPLRHWLRVHVWGEEDVPFEVMEALQKLSQFQMVAELLGAIRETHVKASPGPGIPHVWNTSVEERRRLSSACHLTALATRVTQFLESPPQNGTLSE